MKTPRQNGFTLVEMMISLAILSIVFAVVVEGINTMQARNFVETNKLDLTQQTREFMDQIVNDIDQAGYPNLNMFDPGSFTAPQSAADCTLDPNVACGFISVSGTDLQFEGDVDGSGVSEEWIQLRQTNGVGAAACTAPPCVIQRGTVSKLAWANGAGTTPVYFTEVSGVMNTTIFTPYWNSGSLISPLPATRANTQLYNISAVGITLYVKSSQRDPKTGVYPTVTMVSTAKITNVQSP